MRPIDEREKVLNMHFIEKKSAEKICAEVGIPLGTVKCRSTDTRKSTT